jgi:Xaa-Pro aminopeptidase
MNESTNKNVAQFWLIAMVAPVINQTKIKPVRLYVVPAGAAPTSQSEDMARAAAAGGGTGDGRRFLRFKRLTHIPIQKKLVEPALLSAEEADWLDAYHREVFERVSPLLEGDEKVLAWLREATSPLER